MQFSEETLPSWLSLIELQALRDLLSFSELARETAEIVPDRYIGSHGIIRTMIDLSDLSTPR